MADFPYRLREDATPTMGLIVLRVDETIEDEFRRYIPPDDARMHVTRVHSGDDLTPSSIAEMERALSGAAALLPPAAKFDVVGYGCTSGAALIGSDEVRANVMAGVTTRHVTDPLSAALAAIADLGLERVGIVSPYVASVAEPLRAAFVAEGITVPATLSFGEEAEARVARIDPASIAEAARSLAGQARLDGIFLSCTNLRTQGILPGLRAELGTPVLSSNQALAWHMRKLAGIAAPG
ncbi:maleate cis-trans isomerase family protein [Thioclava nitratireducens]|uniref:maleate cis-trans isomerase family protein n=1 Tax=Thioclava nitratireducens TaxID=1915078 RepID=UPI00247FF950|nr:aspartate/glutamate racemase family protein [Thioclava nitratireducens]WGT51894.1 aspartate/glutamate racemase family protein [Thioclava nitratireducens]